MEVDVGGRGKGDEKLSRYKSDEEWSGGSSGADVRDLHGRYESRMRRASEGRQIRLTSEATSHSTAVIHLDTFPLHYYM